MDISMGIDIAAYSMMTASASVMSQVSVSMLKNTMELQEMQGAQITKMMEQSVNPGVGANIDIRI